MSVCNRPDSRDAQQNDHRAAPKNFQLGSLKNTIPPKAEPVAHIVGSWTPLRQNRLTSNLKTINQPTCADHDIHDFSNHAPLVQLWFKPALLHVEVTV